MVDTIPMSEAVRAILWPLQGAHPEKVFTYAAGKEGPCPITRPGVDTAFGRATVKAGIVDFRFHDLRHTFATRLLRAQGNIKVVQKMLRHTTLATTSKYAHALDEDLRQALEVMEGETAAPSPGETTGHAAKDLKTKG